MDIVFLIVAVPAIIVGAVLYATVTEIRHNRMRRSRWDLRGTTMGNDGPVLLPAGHRD
jgi:hypothetical protein